MCTVGNTRGGLGCESSHCIGGWAARFAILMGVGWGVPKQQYLEIFSLRPYISSREGDSSLCLGDICLASWEQGCG